LYSGSSYANYIYRLIIPQSVRFTYVGDDDGGYDSAGTPAVAPAATPKST